MGYYCPTCRTLGEKRPLTYRENTVGCLAHGCDAIWEEEVPAQEPVVVVQGFGKSIELTLENGELAIVKKRYAKR